MGADKPSTKSETASARDRRHRRVAVAAAVLTGLLATGVWATKQDEGPSTECAEVARDLRAVRARIDELGAISWDEVAEERTLYAEVEQLTAVSVAGGC